MIKCPRTFFVFASLAYLAMVLWVPSAEAQQAQAEKNLKQIIVDIILSLSKGSTAPADLDKLAGGDLLSCWNEDFKNLSKFCLNHVEIDVDGKEPAKSAENIPNKPNPPALIYGECLFSGGQLDNVTGRVKSKDLVIMGIKEGTTLSAAQKESVVVSLDKCMSTPFPWPQPLMQYNGMPAYIEEASSKTWTVDQWDSADPIPHFGGPTHKEELYRNFLETLVCVFKSLLENGCKP